VDFVSQLLIGVIHGPEGGSAAIVDEYYRQYEDYDVEEGIPDQRRARKLFDQSLKFVKALFPNLQDEAELRWSNRADFYSLFLAISDIIREHEVPKDPTVAALRKALEDFSKDVNRRLANEEAKVVPDVIEYVRAVEKGVNDKARRADRHRVLVALFEKTLGLKSTVDQQRSQQKSKKK
jgi:hypothetical protein